MLTINAATLSRGNKILLQNASVNLFEKQKVGLVGHNGCGKSSFFALIQQQLHTDKGDIYLHPHITISHLSQQLPDSNQEALDFVLEGDTEYHQLITQLTLAEQQQNDAEILALHERLTQTQSYSKPAKAAAIIAGLGFKPHEAKAPVNSFSGGWRMRLSLARCLMSPAQLLLLDEPTNHLDMEAIYWLEKWLKQSPASIILISHDREFLDTFATNILHIDNKTLTLYTGNYSQFEETRAQRLALQQAAFEKQQTQITHLVSFIQRFKAKATKAKQAQSRVKALERMEIIASAQLDSPFSFSFYPCPKASNPLLSCDKVSAGYDATRPILNKIQLSLAPGDRVALLGPNGQGKSTLIKTLTGNLDCLTGTIHRSNNLSIGYFAQHQLETLNPDLSPVQTLQQLSPEVREQTIRDFLGGFNFIGDMAMSAIRPFSGGEKARLALAKLVWLKPNLLLLDEPTNHLDLEMRAAIELALQSFEGALILISHDRHLIRTTVDDFYLVFQGQVTPFKGDLDDYYQWLQSKDNKPALTQSETGASLYREKKSLQNRLKKLEQQLKMLNETLQEIEIDLADPKLYNASEKTTLNQLLTKQQQLITTHTQLEEEWLEAMLQFEAP